MTMNIERLEWPQFQWRTWLRSGLCAFVLGGCGGGVDSGGTGGAATYASGPITGFGSVIVNGVRFDDSSASVSDEDGSRNRGELRLGMLVEVRGGAIDSSSGSANSVASSISFSSELVGPVDATPAPGATSLAVFGQIVDVKATTVFEDSLVGGLTALVAGNVVEVYGLFDALSGRYTATRIERKSGTATEFRIRGRVSALSTAQKTFVLGGRTISYSSISDVPTTLSDGMLVRARVSATPVGGLWIATRVRSGASSPDDRSHAKLEGLVSTFTSIAQFSVDGVPVTTDASTSFPDGTTFTAGDRVEAEGTMINGALSASKVELKTDSGTNEFDFRGPLDAINTGAQTIVVRGVTISYAGQVEFRPNGTSAANLVPPVNVEVRATLVNGNQYQATRIEFK
jgi:Domain of unknown function (DUF5666)